MIGCFSQDADKKDKFHILDHCGLYKYLNRFLIARDNDGKPKPVSRKADTLCLPGKLLAKANWNPSGMPSAVDWPAGAERTMAR